MKIPLFNKKEGKHEPMDVLPRAGCGSLTDEQLDRIADEFDGLELNTTKSVFYRGFLAALGFIAVTSDAETYGADVVTFAENAYSYVEQDLMIHALTRAAEGILDFLDEIDPMDGEEE